MYHEKDWCKSWIGRIWDIDCLHWLILSALLFWLQSSDSCWVRGCFHCTSSIGSTRINCNVKFTARSNLLISSMVRIVFRKPCLKFSSSSSSIGYQLHSVKVRLNKWFIFHDGLLKTILWKTNKYKRIGIEKSIDNFFPVSLRKMQKYSFSSQLES